jgi:thiol-disulfide isomerase/thioredoxin
MNDSQPLKSERTWLYVALAFIGFWGVYLAFFLPNPSTEGPDLANSGFGLPVDYSWKLLDLDDNPVEFSRFKGKTVFLNVWATWCGPCVREMPSITALAANPALKDVEFVCVSTDDSGGIVKSFLAGKGWPMTVLRASDLPPSFSTEGIPATFLIGPDGKIASSQVGSANWNEPKVVAFLENLSKKTAGMP